MPSGEKRKRPVDPPGMKWCGTCKTFKQIDNFGKHKGMPGGLRYSCKECSSAYKKDYSKKNKAKIAQYQRDSAGNPRVAMRRLVQAAEDRAKKNGLEFSITKEWLLEKYNEQNGRCLLTDIPFDLTYNNKIKRMRPFSPSLDKIDINGGYTKSNTRLILTCLNFALNAFGEEVFTLIACAYFHKINTKENKNASRTS